MNFYNDLFSDDSVGLYRDLIQTRLDRYPKTKFQGITYIINNLFRSQEKKKSLSFPQDVVGLIHGYKLDNTETFTLPYDESYCVNPITFDEIRETIKDLPLRELRHFMNGCFCIRSCRPYMEPNGVPIQVQIINEGQFVNSFGLLEELVLNPISLEDKPVISELVSDIHRVFGTGNKCDLRKDLTLIRDDGGNVFYAVELKKVDRSRPRRAVAITH